MCFYNGDDVRNISEQLSYLTKHKNTNTIAVKLLEQYSQEPCGCDMCQCSRSRIECPHINFMDKELEVVKIKGKLYIR